MQKHIAYFITPHGFGHAARASAVMEAMHRLSSDWHFHIYTRVPEWFFEDSLTASFSYHDCLTDIGLVQTSALNEDVRATVSELNTFLPYKDSLLEELGASLRDSDCVAVLCDISALGIAAAQRAGRPSVLIENFTWDWIYNGYLSACQSKTDASRLEVHSSTFARIFAEANIHIQAEPVSQPVAADLTVMPVSRQPRLSRRTVREALDIPEDEPMVLITMGGVIESYGFMAQLHEMSDVQFIIPGSQPPARRQYNVTMFPHQSQWFHPDLIGASDAVIGKLGYSTLAEVFHAGASYGYVLRDIFPESDVLARFVAENMLGLPLTGPAFRSGQWLHSLAALLDQQSRQPQVAGSLDNGANMIAVYLNNQFV